jgi:CheY-like chemotaxis protein
MDCQMPEMDGYAATAAIRDVEERVADGKRLQVPIVALTANALQGDRERCLAAGMTDYAVKPLSLDRLQQLVERYLAGPRAAGSSPPAHDATAGWALQ